MNDCRHVFFFLRWTESVFRFKISAKPIANYRTLLSQHRWSFTSHLRFDRNRIRLRGFHSCIFHRTKPNYLIPYPIVLSSFNVNRHEQDNIKYRSEIAANTLKEVLWFYVSMVKHRINVKTWQFSKDKFLVRLFRQHKWSSTNRWY